MEPRGRPKVVVSPRFLLSAAVANLQIAMFAIVNFHYTQKKAFPVAGNASDEFLCRRWGGLIQVLPWYSVQFAQGTARSPFALWAMSCAMRRSLVKEEKGDFLSKNGKGRSPLCAYMLGPSARIGEAARDL